MVSYQPSACLLYIHPVYTSVRLAFDLHLETSKFEEHTRSQLLPNGARYV